MQLRNMSRLHRRDPRRAAHRGTAARPAQRHRRGRSPEAGQAVSANTPHADLRRGTTRLVDGEYVTDHSQAANSEPSSRFVRTPGKTAGGTK